MIFYFSATGNSRQVAKSLAARTDETLIDIVECITNNNYQFNVAPNERIGFVTPTYFWGLPCLVADFINALQIDGYNHQYTYIVTTFGSFCGGAPQHLKRLLRPKNINLEASFSIRMVDVWTPIFDLSDKAKNEQKTEAAQPKIAEVCDLVVNCQKGNFLKWPLPDFICRISYLFYNYSRKTSNFYVEEQCNGCGLCEKKCPLGAIAIKNGKPTWVKDKCAICLGCLHRCPKFAIQYGHFTKKHGQFVNSGKC